MRYQAGRNRAMVSLLTRPRSPVFAIFALISGRAAAGAKLSALPGGSATEPRFATVWPLLPALPPSLRATTSTIEQSAVPLAIISW